MTKAKIITKGKKRKGVGGVAKRPVDGRAVQVSPEAVDEVGVLPCPVPTDPAMGDKTPEVMAWYREHRPEEFRRRYGNRVCPEVDDVVRCGVMGDDDAMGPVSDFEDDEVVVVKPRVIMG
ncbi:hypothetical protein DES53_115143 [Roseimicrobium gellanilyticum]|uniref:Uncharacterized protein n=1 Tax=Roseimicrobium gellanilyticum TaxID=748857 RepID=A0A366H5T9_9BACT|nr:hypothetical protein [Roseimicrobium gellanilyticum]RBP37002.1 hypothetical protein DES53_115143 [Roseimicrobium gellanilyticum]